MDVKDNFLYIVLRVSNWFTNRIIDSFFKVYNKNKTPLIERFFAKFFKAINFLSSPYRRLFRYYIYDIADEIVDEEYLEDDIGIVIQGPLAKEMTLITALRYRRLCPYAPIVISTWKQDALLSESFKQICTDNNIDIVTSIFPDQRIKWNLNLQVTTSHNGVEYICRKYTKLKYILKCRTDQIILRRDFPFILKNALEMFPPIGDAVTSRVVFLGARNSYKYTPFDLSDFLIFGEKTYVRMMYDIPKLDIKERHEKILLDVKNKINAYEKNNIRAVNMYDKEKIKQWSRLSATFDFPEIYLARNFYNKIAGDIIAERNIQTYWSFLKRYAIIIDSNLLMMYWPKYFEGYRIFSAYIPNTGECGGLDYATWLDIYLHYDEATGLISDY